MNKKWFFFDFDGTLYSHETNSVPVSAQLALRTLQAQGHILVIATGRGPASLPFIQRELGVPCETMILLNGQLIWHQNRTIFKRFITPASLKKVLVAARTHNLAYGGYSATGEIVDHINDRVMTVWRDFKSPMPIMMTRFEEKFPLYQGHLYMTEDEAADMQEFFSDFYLNWSHPYMVNLISRDAGKSRAIRWLFRKWGIAEEDTYAFGDGWNDQDMLQCVGHGIAMGNAVQALKQQAEHITGTVDEDGIWYALVDYDLIPLN